MTRETGSHDTPLIDWTRRRWLTEEPQIEDARKLEREGKGTVFDDGLGGACEWVPFGAEALDGAAAKPKPMEILHG